MRTGIATLGVWLALAISVSAQTFGAGNFLRVTTKRVTVTTADNGSGTSPTMAIAVGEIGYAEGDCLDANGCTLSVSESGAKEGQDLVIVQVSASPGLLTISDAAGVVELLNGTAYVMAQYEGIWLRYIGDRWVELSRSQFAGALTASDVTTLTNKTYDAEGSGNVLTVPFTEFIPGATCESDYVSISYAYAPMWRSLFASAPSPVCIAGSNITTAANQFPDSGTKILWQERALPSDWTGTIGLIVYWRTTATTGSVVWQMATACVADSEVVDPAWNATQTVTDAALGTTLWRNTTASTSLTTTGCAAGETFYFKLFRDPTHASDTIASTAELLGVQLTIRRAI